MRPADHRRASHAPPDLATLGTPDASLTETLRGEQG